MKVRILPGVIDTIRLPNSIYKYPSLVGGCGQASPFSARAAAPITRRCRAGAKPARGEGEFSAPIAPLITPGGRADSKRIFFFGSFLKFLLTWQQGQFTVSAYLTGGNRGRRRLRLPVSALPATVVVLVFNRFFKGVSPRPSPTPFHVLDAAEP